MDRADGLSGIDHMLAEAEGIGEFLGEMAVKTFRPHNAFTVGEVFNEKPEEIADFIGENGYFSSMFDFAETVYGKSDRGWYDSRRILIRKSINPVFFPHRKNWRYRYDLQYYRKP